MADVVTDAIVYPEPLDEWLPQDIKQVGLWVGLGWVGGMGAVKAGQQTAAWKGAAGRRTPAERLVVGEQRALQPACHRRTRPSSGQHVCTP